MSLGPICSALSSILARQALALVLMCLSLPALSQSPNVWSNEINPLVRQGMNLNFEGDFAAAETLWQSLRRDYPTHPVGALFSGETLFFRQLYDLFDYSLVTEIETTAQEAALLSREWLELNPESAQAALFAGQAEIQLGRVDGLVGRYPAAGRHAERAQNFLELALRYDPGLIEARYWLGLYAYYASTIPAVIQLFSWLWFIPEPDAPGGLNMLTTVSQSNGIQRHSAELALDEYLHVLRVRLSTGGAFRPLAERQVPEQLADSLRVGADSRATTKP